MCLRRVSSILGVIALFFSMLVTGTAAENRVGSAARPDSTWQIETVDAPRFFSEMGDRYLAVDSAGHPHLAYGFDHLYYAWNDGTFWHSEVVDSEKTVGEGAALALDGADRPHISYYDGVYTEGGVRALKYAHLEGTTWITETVDDTIWSGGSYASSIAVDVADRPHIIYYSSHDSALKYAYYDGSAWYTSTVESGVDLSYEFQRPSLVLDAEGHPHVSYPDASGGIKYAHFDGTSWTVSTVDSGGGSATSLVLDTAGRPHVSFVSFDDLSLRHAYYDGSAWQIETVDSAYVQDVSMVLDGAGVLHLGYGHSLDQERWEIKHAWYDGASWNSEVVRSGLDEASLASLARDSQDRLCLSYFDGTYLVYLYDEGGWGAENIDSAALVSSGVSIDVFPDGRPAIAYCYSHDLDECQVGRYAYYDGSAWQFDTFDNLGPDGGGSLARLILDSSGSPHIVYGYYDADLYRPEVRYAYHDGSSWITTTVAIGAASPSLALDAGGYPHIAYVNDDYELHYTYLDGGGWHDESLGVLAASTRIALDAAGRPAIAFVDGSGLQLARYDGASWSFEVVDSSQHIGGISLALDGAGRPHIGYGFEGFLKYAYYDGSAWHKELPNGAERGDGPSLALDASDRPHIAYSMLGPYIGYARYDGAAWQVETVGGANFAYGYPSLALDENQLPYIAYSTGYLGDLKYATIGPCVPVEQVSIAGPALLAPGAEGTFQAGVLPLTASLPITFTWSLGDGSYGEGATVTHSYALTGSYTLAVTAGNSCGTAVVTGTVRVEVEVWSAYLPVVVK